MSSVFAAESGEWKLGGFEVLSSVKEEDPVIYVCLTLEVALYNADAYSVARNTLGFSQTLQDILLRKL